MTLVVTPTEARTGLYKFIHEVNTSHTPIHIKGKHNGAVLMSEEDWHSIEETLYLLSIPGMRKSIKKGIDTPVRKCSKELDW